MVFIQKATLFQSKLDAFFSFVRLND